MHISETLAIKKYGNVYNAARNKYKDKISNFIKSEKFICDLDAISSMEIGIFGEILGDFK